jgi:NAD(P)-dependent dehydrogenase (short-subunit alcohol dehydrogenase family)
VARRLADQGAHVLIHGHDRHRGKQVVDQIQAAGHGSAVFLPADLSSLAEVRRLADLVRQDCDRLNVLINPECTVPVLELDNGTRIADILGSAVISRSFTPSRV